MKTFGLVLSLALLFAVRPAAAVPPLVRVSACEPMMIGDAAGQRLTLALAGHTQSFDTAVLWPIAAAGNDTCSIVDFTPPPGWEAYRGDGGSVLFFGSPVALGQSLDGFVITLDDVRGCFEVSLDNFLLLDGAGYGVACFYDCVVTPTRSMSWGRLKASFR